MRCADHTCCCAVLKFVGAGVARDAVCRGCATAVRSDVFVVVAAVVSGKWLVMMVRVVRVGA